MYYNVKKVFGILTFIVGAIFSSPIFASGYYGGSKGAEIFLNGEVIIGGVSEMIDTQNKEYRHNGLSALIKYEGKLFRCHTSLERDYKLNREDDGFMVHCWGRKKTD